MPSSVGSLCHSWRADGVEHQLQMVPVPGTEGTPFEFGGRGHSRLVDLPSFYIAATPATQALWLHVMGSNPAVRPDLRCPVENVSWRHITAPGGFLERLNSGPILATIAEDKPDLRFRLPSETEWEYAARGGPNWKDRYVYSGSNDPAEVAWYGPRWTAGHELVTRLVGWRLGWRLINRLRWRRPTRTHDVASKAPNQLGTYDMSGNVWEWCQDTCTDDWDSIPGDGSPYVGPGAERRLRGGCHHNWNLHCTVSWRYGIIEDAHDGCIGFRLVLGRGTESNRR